MGETRGFRLAFLFVENVIEFKNYISNAEITFKIDNLTLVLRRGYYVRPVPDKKINLKELLNKENKDYTLKFLNETYKIDILIADTDEYIEFYSVADEIIKDDVYLREYNLGANVELFSGKWINIKLKRRTDGSFSSVRDELKEEIDKVLYMYGPKKICGKCNGFGYYVDPQNERHTCEDCFGRGVL